MYRRPNGFAVGGAYSLPTTNNLDFLLDSPDLSPDRLSNSDDFIPVHPDPIAVTKILGIQRKISLVLDSISYELDRIPLPDGEDDYLRRHQRVIEFSTRLSRNYLYDLGRQITDIQRYLKAINPDTKMKLSRRSVIIQMQAIEQKLISAHQLLLTALNAYWKHIPSSVLRNHPGKLREILQVVVQLKNICNEIKLTPDIYCSGDEKDIFLGKETENRCCVILSKFRGNSDNGSQVLSHTTRSTVVTPSRTNKQRNRKLAKRLSMYTMDMKLAKAYQPKKSRSMIQIPRDRKHMSGSSKHQQNVLPTSKKSHSASSAKTSKEVAGSKITKINVPLKEDDIQTIMETVPSDLDVESARSISSNRNSEIYKDSFHTIEIVESTKENKKLSKSKQDNKKSKDNSSGVRCLSTLVPVVDDLLEIVQNTPSNLRSDPASIDILCNLLQKGHLTQNTNAIKAYFENEIEIGAKNMKLICCTTNEEYETNKKISETWEHDDDPKYNDVSCQVTNLKINGSIELTVSESAALNFTDYQKQYQSSVQENPIYTSNTQNKPWEVVAWIAEKLVEELIIELSEEFEMEEIIQKLFDLEFQEF